MNSKYFIILILLIALQFINCAITKQYAFNRGKDLQDIVNLGVEKEIYGVSIQLGSIILGYQDGTNGHGYGFRYGHLGGYHTGDSKNPILYLNTEGGGNLDGSEIQIYPGNVDFIFPTNYHKPIDSNNLRSNKKKYVQLNTEWRSCKATTTGARYLNEELGKGFSCWYSSTGRIAPHPIEISIGLKFGFRVGLNAGEIFDFIGGIVGFDPMNDDSSINKPDYIYMPQPIEQNAVWESELDALDEKMDRRVKK